MKNISLFLFFIINTFCINIFQVIAFVSPTEQYISKNISLEEEIRKLDLSILEMKDNDYEKYILLSKKASLQIEVKNNEKLIYCLNNDIKNTCYISSINGWWHNTKISEYIYDIKTLEKDKYNYDAKYKELKYEEAEQKEKQEAYLSYLERADKLYIEEDYKNAIENYQRACWYYETYHCYYWLWLANFKSAKIYYSKISYYWYESLYKKSIEWVNTNTDKAIALSENDEQKEKANNLLEELNNYLDEINKIPNKEIEDTKHKEIKVIENKKGELIYEKLQNITSKYSEQKKYIIYKNLLTKIEELKDKKINEETLNILEYLRLKIEDYLSSNFNN